MFTFPPGSSWLASFLAHHLSTLLILIKLHRTIMKKYPLTLSRIKHVAGTFMLVSSLVFLQACGSDKKNESRTEDALEKTGDAIVADTKDAVNKAKEDLKEAGDKADRKSDEVGADFKRERDEAVAKMNVQKDKLDAKIAELKAKANNQSDKAKADTERQKAKLEVERNELSEDIDKAKSATADAWKDMKAGFKHAGHKLDDAFDKAGDKLKRNDN
jgi:hypothetical protein